MRSHEWKLPVGRSFAIARLIWNGAAYGISLTDERGRPMGRGKTIGHRVAQGFADAMASAPTPEARAGLLWALLGYGTKDKMERARNIRVIA